MSDFNDPAYWLERAEQARQLAECFADDGARKQMALVAQGYEHMAKLAEQRKLITQAPIAFAGHLQRE